MELLKKLQIKLKDPVFVFPNKPTPQTSLYLSPLDRSAPLFMYTLYFYDRNEAKSNETAFQDVKEALEEVLVLYYPAAGRIRQNDVTGHLELACTAEGAMMVEASTDIEIKDLGHLSEANPEFEKLVWHLPPVPDSPLVVAQVTRFGCGGFCIGFGARHELFDGMSALNFLTDWSRLARKVAVSEIEVPAHNREIMKPRPSGLTSQELEERFMKRFEGIPIFRKAKEDMRKWEKTVSEFAKLDLRPKYVTKVFEVNKKMLETLKRKALEGGHLKSCSTFDILTAHSWLARIKALEMQPTERIVLQFTVNGRPRINPPINSKFIGNVFIMAFNNCTVAEILESPFHNIVKKVQEAKNRITDSYIWDSVNALDVMDKQALPSFRETTIVIDWTRIPLEAFDFGWGGAKFGTPVSMPLLDVIFILHGGPKGDVRVRLGLLPEIMSKFEQKFLDMSYLGLKEHVQSNSDSGNVGSMPTAHISLERDEKLDSSTQTEPESYNSGEKNTESVANGSLPNGSALHSTPLDILKEECVCISSNGSCANANGVVKH